MNKKILVGVCGALVAGIAVFVGGRVMHNNQKTVSAENTVVVADVQKTEAVEEFKLDTLGDAMEKQAKAEKEKTSKKVPEIKIADKKAEDANKEEGKSDNAAGTEAAAAVDAGKTAEAAKADAEQPAPQPAPETEQPTPQPVVTNPFGNFTSTTLSGSGVDQSIFAAAPLTMVNVWGTFCGPCKREMPDLGALQAEYASKGLQIVGILCDVYEGDDTSYASQIVSSSGANYVHILKSDSIWATRVSETYAVPSTIFVDSAGNVVSDWYVGSRSKSSWASIVDKYLK